MEVIESQQQPQLLTLQNWRTTVRIAKSS